MTRETTIRAIGNSAGATIPKAMLERYRIEVPAHIRAHIEAETSETPKPGDPIFENSDFRMAARPLR